MESHRNQQLEDGEEIIYESATDSHPDSTDDDSSDSDDDSDENNMDRDHPRYEDNFADLSAPVIGNARRSFTVVQPLRDHETHHGDVGRTLSKNRRSSLTQHQKQSSGTDNDCESYIDTDDHQGWATDLNDGSEGNLMDFGDNRGSQSSHDLISRSNSSSGYDTQTSLNSGVSMPGSGSNLKISKSILKKDGGTVPRFSNVDGRISGIQNTRLNDLDYGVEKAKKILPISDLPEQSSPQKSSKPNIESEFSAPVTMENQDPKSLLTKQRSHKADIFATYTPSDLSDSESPPTTNQQNKSPETKFLSETDPFLLKIISLSNSSGNPSMNFTKNSSTLKSTQLDTPASLLISPQLSTLSSRDPSPISNPLSTKPKNGSLDPTPATLARSEKLKQQLSERYSLIFAYHTYHESNFDYSWTYNPLAVIRHRREAWQAAVKSKAPVNDIRKVRMLTGKWDIGLDEVREYLEELMASKSTGENGGLNSSTSGGAVNEGLEESSGKRGGVRKPLSTNSNSSPKLKKSNSMLNKFAGSLGLKKSEDVFAVGGISEPVFIQTPKPLSSKSLVVEFGGAGSSGHSGEAGSDIGESALSPQDSANSDLKAHKKVLKRLRSGTEALNALLGKSVNGGRNLINRGKVHGNLFNEDGLFVESIDKVSEPMQESALLNLFMEGKLTEQAQQSPESMHSGESNEGLSPGWSPDIPQDLKLQENRLSRVSEEMSESKHGGIRYLRVSTASENSNEGGDDANNIRHSRGLNRFMNPRNILRSPDRPNIMSAVAEDIERWIGNVGAGGMSRMKESKSPVHGENGNSMPVLSKKSKRQRKKNELNSSGKNLTSTTQLTDDQLVIDGVENEEFESPKLFNTRRRGTTGERSRKKNIFTRSLLSKNDQDDPGDGTWNKKKGKRLIRLGKDRKKKETVDAPMIPEILTDDDEVENHISRTLTESRISNPHVLIRRKSSKKTRVRKSNSITSPIKEAEQSSITGYTDRQAEGIEFDDLLITLANMVQKILDEIISCSTDKLIDFESQLIPFREIAQNLNISVGNSKLKKHISLKEVPELKKLEQSVLDDSIISGKSIMYEAQYLNLQSSFENMGKTAANIARDLLESDEKIQTMIVDMEKIGQDVHETISRRLKALEDQIQQRETTRQGTTKWVMELLYQLLEAFLIVVGYVIWLIYKGFKISQNAYETIRDFLL